MKRATTTALHRSTSRAMHPARATATNKSVHQHRDAPPLPGETQDRPKIPEVFDYLDYRRFLAEWFQFKKVLQPGYSGAVFARKANLGSHSFLGMVIRGSRNLSPTTVRAFAQALDLRGPSERYFQNLVLYNQAKRAEDETHYLQAMKKAIPPSRRSTAVHELSNYREYMSDVCHVLVRELVACGDFKPEPRWMSLQLKGAFTAAHCERAWKRLVEMKMVVRTTDGWKQSDPKILIEDYGRFSALSQFQLSFLDFTTRTIGREPDPIDRDLGFLFTSIPAKDLPLLKQKLRDFRRELHDMFPSDDTQPDTVVAIGLQLLKTTKTTNTTTQPKEKGSESKT
jgi:uncharacterized protein (TIGR02147 family)